MVLCMVCHSVVLSLHAQCGDVGPRPARPACPRVAPRRLVPPGVGRDGADELAGQGVGQAPQHAWGPPRPIACMAFPCRPPSRMGSAAVATFLWYLSGLVFLCLSFGNQLRCVASEGRNARRRTIGMPSEVVASIGQDDSSRSQECLLAWLAALLQVFTGQARPQACVYALCGELYSYLGFSANRRDDPGGRHLGLPSRRGAEHLRDLVLGRRGGGLVKSEVWGREQLGSLVLYVASVGAAMPMRALERSLIRLVSPAANTAQAHARGWRRPEPSGARVCPTRRRGPPPRIRRRGPDAAMSPLDRASGASVVVPPMH